MAEQKLKISPSEVHRVVAKLRAKTSSVFGEARRLDCYHATLRKAIREVIGVKEYDKLMGKADSIRRLKVSPTDVHSVVARLKASEATISDEAVRLGVAEPTLVKALKATLGPEGYREFRESITRWGSKGSSVGNSNRHARGHGYKERPPAPTPPPLELVRQPRTCQRDGHRLKGGTDGEGHALLWCTCCPYREPVVTRRLAPPAGAEGSPEDAG